MTGNENTSDGDAGIKAQMLGTVPPPKTLPWDAPLKAPPLELLLRPFKDVRAVAYFYCNNCALFAEIGRDTLDRLLDVVNENADGPIWDAAKRSQFNGKKKFVVGYGCPKCSMATAMTVVDIPSERGPASDAQAGANGKDGQ